MSGQWIILICGPGDGGVQSDPLFSSRCDSPRVQIASRNYVCVLVFLLYYVCSHTLGELRRALGTEWRITILQSCPVLLQESRHFWCSPRISDLLGTSLQLVSGGSHKGACPRMVLGHPCGSPGTSLWLVSGGSHKGACPRTVHPAG